MTDAAQKVLHDALALDDPERARVAAELIASLDGPTDPRIAELTPRGWKELREKTAAPA